MAHGLKLSDAAAHKALAEAPCPATPIDKWALLRNLSIARAAFNVSDRDLTVLQALLSFHPPQMLEADTPTIVFPSNARLSERLHGMPESTLRRHIAALVCAGLILRHDSPNGKRFARRDETGQIARAFGFDLRPLLVRAHDIFSAADQARRDATELHALREEIILHLRDISSLSGTTSEAIDLQRQLRRKLTLGSARRLVTYASDLAAQARSLVPTAEVSGGYDSQNERHIQDSNKIPSESESCNEDKVDTALTLTTVLEACTAAKDYAATKITDWVTLIATAQTIYPMMGITPDVWHQSKRSMGATEAAVTVLCILQRFEKIAKPGAYLRSLCKKAGEGSFGAGGMVNALLVSHRRVPS